MTPAYDERGVLIPDEACIAERDAKVAALTENVITCRTALVAGVEALALALGWLTGISSDAGDANPAEAAILERIAQAATTMREALT